jgi:glutamate racemase
MDPRPIGVFDSGVGGLGVVRAIQSIAPHESIVYFADTAWFPYGPRPTAEIRKRSFAISRKLFDLDCKIVVVACNTASAAALSDLREIFPIPFVGMVPGVKPAAEHSRSHHVVVLATPGTLSGELYADVRDRFGGATRVEEVAGVGLAALVEEGRAGTNQAREAVRKALAPAVERGADTVVLGCTHYTFLVPDIRAEFPSLEIVDTADPVARRLASLLQELGIEAPQRADPALSLIVSGDRSEFQRKLKTLGFTPATPAEVAG